MSIRTGVIAAAAAALFIGAAFWSYGHYQYRQGVADTKTKTVLAQISIEQGMQYERDQADADYRGAVLARETAQRDLASARGQLDRLLTDARTAKATGASSGSDDTGADWISGFESCYREYEGLVTDAARWADQVNGLQGYARALQPK